MIRVKAVLDVYEGSVHEDYLCSFERHVILIIEPVMNMVLEFDDYDFVIEEIVQNVSEGLLRIFCQCAVDERHQLNDFQKQLSDEWKKVDRGL